MKNRKPQPNRKKYIEILRGMTGEQRLRTGFELFDMATKIMIEGIKTQNRSITPEEIQEEVIRRMMRCHRKNSSVLSSKF